MINYLTKIVKRGFFLTAAVMLFFAGVNSASAYPLPFYMKRYVAADGWIMSIMMDNFRFEPAEFDWSKPFSKGGLLSLRSAAEVYGKSPYGINSGIIDHGVEMSCLADISDGSTAGIQGVISPTAQISGTVGTATNLGVQMPITFTPPTANLNGNAALNLGIPTNVTIGVTPGITVPLGPTIGVTPSGQFSVNGNVTPTLGLSASVIPSISVHVKPGQRKMISLAHKNMASTAALVDDQQVNVMLDNCMGPASLRVYTMFRISSSRADTVLYLYSRKINL